VCGVILILDVTQIELSIKLKNANTARVPLASPITPNCMPYCMTNDLGGDRYDSVVYDLSICTIALVHAGIKKSVGQLGHVAGSDSCYGNKGDFDDFEQIGAIVRQSPLTILDTRTAPPIGWHVEKTI
jgi:hypothetical protein